MKRLPTKAEFEALLKLPHNWDDELKGFVITASNGNELFLPASGYRYGTDVRYVGSCGYYWSATPYDESYAWDLFFTFRGENVCANDRNRDLSVRFISYAPCDGYIDMGTGIYWAIENYHEGEKIYYTWDEAMAIQDKVNGSTHVPEDHSLTIPESMPIDWEQRRYEIAKAALAGLLANPSFSGTAGIAKRAVKYADDMIKQLKQHNN